MTYTEEAIPGIERYPITDRAAWLARRQKDITASAAGALLGAHEYITPYGLWALKSGLVAEDPDETPLLKRGRLLEPIALNLLREMHPSWTISEPRSYYRDPSARIGATPDAFARDPLRPGRGVIQVKTVEPGVFRRKWRIDWHGAIEPPLWIAVQALVEAELTGASWAAVAAMRVGFGLDLDLIDIPLHKPLMDRIKAEAASFWRSVDAKQPPSPDLRRDGALIEELYAPTGEAIDLSGDNYLVELVDERARLGADGTKVKNRLKEIRAELLLKLGAASSARLADGRLLTASLVQRKAGKAYEYTDIRVSKGPGNGQVY